MNEKGIKQLLKLITLDRRFLEVLIFHGIPLTGILFSVQQIGHIEPQKLVLVLLGYYCFFLHLYYFNDFCHLSTDRPDREKMKRSVFHLPPYLILTLSIISGMIVIGSSLYLHTLPIAGGMLALSLTYSSNITKGKSIPFLPYIIHFIAGNLYFLWGYLVYGRDLRYALTIGTFFAIVYVAGQINHELKDYDQDLEENIRTTPHILGRKLSFWISFVLFMLSYVYVFLLYFRNIVGILPLPFLGPAIIFHVIFAFRVRKNKFTRKSHKNYKRVYQIIYTILGIAILIDMFTKLLS